MNNHNSTLYDENCNVKETSSYYSLPDSNNNNIEKVKANQYDKYTKYFFKNIIFEGFISL